MLSYLRSFSQYATRAFQNATAVRATVHDATETHRLKQNAEYIQSLIDGKNTPIEEYFSENDLVGAPLCKLKLLRLSFRTAEVVCPYF